MFEVITRTQPDDYQSLEILKEAYTKLGRMDDTFHTSRKLAKFMIVQQIFPEETVNAALEKVQQRNKNLQGQTLAASLLVELCGEDTDKIDQAISALIDRTKGAFIPLEYYDFDRQLARMLPDNLTLGRLCVPFDLISRTIMVACCNPFDAAGRAAVQQSLDYTVSWYLARPAAIERTLQDVYRLQPKP